MIEEISVNKVSFFRNENPVLKNVDFQIKKGECVGLIGPNGAGKSTLLKLLVNILHPVEGEILLGGKNICDWTQQALSRRIAYLPQGISVGCSFSCREIVLMGRYARLGRFQRESPQDVKIAEEAMRQTETEAFSEKSITELSGGERQRVLIARALAQEASFLLLDEPTANLDLHYQLGLLDLVASLVKKNMTVIMAIHDLNLAARYCHRLLLLDQGRIVADGSAERVLTPDHLRNVYGIEAEVTRHQRTDQHWVVPLHLIP